MPSFCYFIICWLLIAVILSGFFSASEIVYAKVNKLKLKRQAEKNDKNAILALNLVEDYTKLISSILVGNNLVNIGASSAASLLFITLFPKNGELISIIVMTIVILIFGEILPKTIFSKFAYTASLKISKPLKITEIIFFPIVFVVNKIIGLISKLWTPKESSSIQSNEELEVMTDELEEEGYIDEDTSELVKSAIDFVDKMAFEIMKPRVDLFAIDIEDDIYSLIKEKDFFVYSRIPVYKDTIDDIVGFINTNEVLKKYLKNEKIVIKDMLEKVVLVHKTKTISQVLKDFKKTHIPFAVVKDEFNGTLGIVTLEDILEELVGEIFDETDTIEYEYEKINDNEYIIDGDMNIEDMFDLIGETLDDFESEYSTVGGWCTELLNDFPKIGDKVKYNDLTLSILSVDEVRVLKVKVVKEVIIEKGEEDET